MTEAMFLRGLEAMEMQNVSAISSPTDKDLKQWLIREQVQGKAQLGLGSYCITHTA